MPSLETQLKSGFITDLLVPPPGTQGHDSDDLTAISVSVARGLLQDFEAFIRSSPLVTNAVEIHAGHAKYLDVPSLLTEFGIEADPEYANGNKWIQFEITDKLPLLFGATSTTLVYHTAMRRTTTGFESVTNPGNGVRIHGKFDVVASTEDGGEGILNFVEHNETRCNLFLAAYIKATTGAAHREMHERFKGRWNDEMKKKLGRR